MQLRVLTGALQACRQASGTLPSGRQRTVSNTPPRRPAKGANPFAKGLPARSLPLESFRNLDRSHSKPAGAAANAAKYLAGEAGFDACQTAIMTHGGFGYAREYHVERYLREAMIPWIAPVSPNMICSYIAEKVLGLPKSY